MRISHRLALLTVCLGFAAAAFPQAPAPARGPEKTVRMIYLVSRDRQPRADYQFALDRAIRDLQLWYGRQMNGATFKLHNPVVEVTRSTQLAAWFTTHSNGVSSDDWGFRNSLDEAGRLLGARLNDPRHVWVLYSDGPGDKGRGTAGVAYLPENDLLGLIGKHPKEKNRLRWVGGLGHELGHAFGLPHPTDTARHGDALMWTGFYTQYPHRAYLTDEDKAILRRSPFFFDLAGRPLGTKSP